MKPTILIVSEGAMITHVISNQPVDIIYKDFDCLEDGDDGRPIIESTQDQLIVDPDEFVAAVNADIPEFFHVKELNRA